MKKQKIAILSVGTAFAILVLSAITFQNTPEENQLLAENALKNQEIEYTMSTFSENEEIISTFQDSDNLLKLTGDGTVTFDTEDFLLGEKSVKITTKGDSLPEIIRLTNLSSPIDFSGKFLKAWVKISDRSAVHQFRISVSSDNFETYKNYWIHQRASSPTAKSFQNDKWSPITISLTQTTGNTDISKINAIEIFVRDSGKRPVTTWFNSLSLVKSNSKGIVTFTFDDAVGTQYTNAVPILSKYNFSATTFIPIEWLERPGRLSIEQLREMQDVYGWDISSHTMNHVDVSQIKNVQRLEYELVNSKQFLVDNGFIKGAEHFAYPFGNFDNDLSMDLIKDHYKTARIVRGDIETIPGADPYRLRVIYVLSYTPPELVLNRIDRAIENGDWAILVFHGIPDKNADDVQGTYLKSNFQTIVDGVYKKGVDVMTVSEVYDKHLNG